MITSIIVTCVAVDREQNLLENMNLMYYLICNMFTHST